MLLTRECARERELAKIQPHFTIVVFEPSQSTLYRFRGKCNDY